jgi:hypothetical protein
MSRKQPAKEITNVEFGNELGDLNSAKMYELPYANQSKKKNSQKKK